MNITVLKSEKKTVLWYTPLLLCQQDRAYVLWSNLFAVLLVFCFQIASFNLGDLHWTTWIHERKWNVCSLIYLFIYNFSLWCDSKSVFLFLFQIRIPWKILNEQWQHYDITTSKPHSFPVSFCCWCRKVSWTNILKCQNWHSGEPQYKKR